MKSKADMHVHSRYSDKPSEWILRRVGAPECFTDPEKLYQIAKARGMDFVTITDHDAIQGAVELKQRHPDDTFLGQEITAHCPENGCKLHILAWDFTEEQHREITRLRANVYELVPWLKEQGILHSLAHPLYSNNKKLTLELYEKCILLFKHFEALNGMHDPEGSRVSTKILKSLTPRIIDELANRHNLAPLWPEPHIKFFTGGSDDHSSLFIARAHATVPRVSNLKEFLLSIREGNGEAVGEDGSPLAMSLGFYNIAYQYYSDKLARGGKSGNELIVQLFGKFVGGENPTKLTFKEKAGYIARKLSWENLTGKKKKPDVNPDVSLREELKKLFVQSDFQRSLDVEAGSAEKIEDRTFKVAGRIIHQLAFAFCKKVIDKVSQGNVIDSLQAMSALGPIGLGASAFLMAFKNYTKDRQLIRECHVRFFGEQPEFCATERKIWLTDTLDEVNGVSHTIRHIARVAQAEGRDITVATCKIGMRDPELSVPFKNFEPCGEFSLPEYESLKVGFPPVLDVLDFIYRGQFTEIVISTPGPMGLVGRLAAEFLKLKVSGIYHTDFPQYARSLSGGDEAMARLAWKYMEWFYGPMDVVYAPSGAYRAQLLDHGISADRIRVMPRGIDCAVFKPENRDPKFWEMFGANGQMKFIYVGRVSREKDLDVLVEAFQKLNRVHPDVVLTIVGDGPYLAELKQALPKASTVFTGFLSDEALRKAYASADVFVFPSTSDTFGNVVLEAQASGLPAIVSDSGGPKEQVIDGKTGFVTRAKDAESLFEAMKKIVEEPELRKRMSKDAREAMKARSWEKAFETFWGN